MTFNNIGFYRTELRVLKSQTDETEFLTQVAIMIDTLTDERDGWKHRAQIAEDRLRYYE